MTRLEFMAVLYAIKALIEDGKVDKVMEIIDKIIAEAERNK